MNELVLERGYTPLGTFGELYFKQSSMAPKFICYTVEREWANNQRNISCIPEGAYDIEPYSGNRWDNVFIVHDGHNVEKFDGEHNKRWGILFHPENYSHRLQGCIAPVTALSTLNHKWAGVGSKTALLRLQELYEAEGFDVLRIVAKEATV